MNQSTRWFRRLLKLLPSDFQADYARDMERTFRAQHRDAGRGRGVLALWLETLGDLLRTAPREHAAQMTQDARYALRLMRRAPGFTCVAIATLALGIGANTAIFSIVDAVLLRPLPFPDPDRIVRIHERNVEARLLRNAASPPNMLDWKAHSTAFSDMAAYRSASVNLSGRGEPRYLQGLRVSHSFFGVLGTPPTLGRLFTEDEDRRLARVVVVSHAIWRTQLDADPAAVGRAIDLDGEPFEVVGVMPAGFSFRPGANAFQPQPVAELWMPLGVYPGGKLQGRGAHNLQVVARLRGEVTLTEAQAQMSAIASRLAAQYPRSNKGWDVFVEPLHESIVHNVRAIAMILAGAVGFVLLIGCANIGSLLVARASSRAREFAVRGALGASRVRLVRQLLTESLLLSSVGGAIGVALAMAAIAALRVFEVASVPRLEQVAIDARALAATAVVTGMSGWLFGLAPAWYVGRRDLRSRVNDGGRGASAGRERRALQAWLSAAQIAIALVLLAGAGVMIRSIVELNDVDPGFRADGVLAIDLNLSDGRYPRPVDAVRFFQRVVEAAATVPGARSAALVSDPPLVGGVGYWSLGFQIVGRPPKPPGEGDYAYWRCATPGYFEMLGIPLVRGRLFSEAEAPGPPRVAVVNAAFAARYFPGGQAIGERITAGGSTTAEIIGVVGDVRQTSITDAPEPQMYTAVSQCSIGYGTLLVRTDGDPLALVSIVHAAIRRVDPQQPVYNVRRLVDHVRASSAAERLTMRALVVFAGAALALAILGVYGVIAYAVRQRTQEIGVRVALGATRSDVLRLIVGDGVRLAAIGVIAGLAGALWTTRLLSELVFGVSPSDPVTLAAVVAMLVFSAAAASFVPAWRAARIDPSTALRAE